MAMLLDGSRKNNTVATRSPKSSIVPRPRSMPFRRSSERLRHHRLLRPRCRRQRKNTMSARMITLLVAATLTSGLMNTDAWARGGGFGGGHMGGFSGGHIGSVGGGHIGGLGGHIDGLSGMDGAHLGGLGHAHTGSALSGTGMVGMRTHLAPGDHGRRHQLGLYDMDDGSLDPYCDPDTQHFHNGFPNECY